MNPNSNEHRFRADSVERAIELLGDRWTFLILREAFFGVKRFGQFAENLGIARNVLADRLESLVAAGLFDKVAWNRAGNWHEYRLTSSGLDLYGAIVALLGWSDKNLSGPEGSPLILHHDTCGHDFSARVTCSHCDEELKAAEVTPRPGPGATQAASVATARHS